VNCRGRTMHALGKYDCYFTPDHFLELLELQRRSVEWLITAKSTRTELRAIDPKPLADDAVAILLKLRVRQLRN
jgi:hypothetical protein